MYGNLHVFEGREHLNAYAEWLREMGYPLLPHGAALWIVRIILLLSRWSGHIWAAWQVTKQDWAGRPIGYGQKKMIAATYAARTMRWGGVILGLFIVYHILHFTTGTRLRRGAVQPDRRLRQRRQRVPQSDRLAGLHPVACSRSASTSITASGAWPRPSAGATRVNNQLWRGFATVMAIVIAGGNISIPLAVLAGIVR